MRHLENLLGFEIDRDGAPNRYGVSSGPIARWWHAIDLVTAGKWRELLQTQAFTEPACIMQAVSFGCRYTHHEDRKASGYLSIAEAREIMRAVGASEPEARGAAVRSFAAPSPCRQDKGNERWPINAGRLCAEDEAWGFILGIEKTAGFATTVPASCNGRCLVANVTPPATEPPTPRPADRRPLPSSEGSALPKIVHIQMHRRRKVRTMPMSIETGRAACRSDARTRLEVA